MVVVLRVIIAALVLAGVLWSFRRGARGGLGCRRLLSRYPRRVPIAARRMPAFQRNAEKNSTIAPNG